MVIQRLPAEVINQIAAGEVIERPYSVVKELVENSLDAGARRIRVEIQQGGAQRICIGDDGEGFHAEDLTLAFASHATSKLSALTDLDHIASLGFRGEALASIGSIARCSIQSRRHDSGEGSEIRCEGGIQSEVMPCGCPPGTRIEVRDLFFNTPARRRFLKSAGSEKAKIQELLCELSLARLDVDFTFVAEGVEVLRLAAGQTLVERFAQCFGRELAKGLLPVERTFGDLHIEGLIGEPDLARRDGRQELLYVNGRQATERPAVMSVRQAYREYLMGGRFPIYALQIALPPDQVDVNVHPRKAEVRFLDSRRIAGCLYETVRAALQARGAATSVGGVQIQPDLPRARSGFPALPQSLFQEPEREVPVVVREVPEPSGARLSDVGSALPPLRGPVVADERTTPSLHGASPPLPRATAPVRPNPFRSAHSRFLQVHDLYVLLQVDDGLLIVDQHALHERVVYERLRREHRARAVQVQRLLVPTVVELSPSEKAWVLEVQDQLAAAGMQVDDFGPASVAVHAVPAVFAKASPAKLLRALLPVDGEGDAAARLEEQIVERFHSMACRSAVMSGDRLQDSEIAALLAEAATLEHPHNCPHGRPTVLTFTGAELERYFRRRC